MHNRFELTLIKKGEGTRIIGDQVDFFKSGDLIMLSPMLPHQWQSVSLSKICIASAITLFFDADFPSIDFWRLKETTAMRNVLTNSQRGIRLKGKLLKEVSLLLEKAVNINGFDGIILIFEILQTIAMSNEYELLASEGYERKKSIDTGRVNNIINYIFDNLHTKITLEKLAELVSLHPGSLSREFKKSTGFSLVEYINKIRIGNASRLLTETDKQVVDICYETGFQNLSNFNRIFKKIHGITPSDFRKKRFSLQGSTFQ
jgi:AraC-like DNA-binding protein